MAVVVGVTGALMLDSTVVDDELEVDDDEVVRVLGVEVVSSSKSRVLVVVLVVVRLVVVRLLVEVEPDPELKPVTLLPLLPSQSSPRSQQYPSLVHVPKSGQ